jgi:hypothetical protein
MSNPKARRVANQFVWLHDKAADVPAEYLKREITDRGRDDRHHQPTDPRHRHCVDGGHPSPENKRRTDDEHAGKHDVRIRVGHPGKDRMVVEQSLESGYVHAYRECRQ